MVSKCRACGREIVAKAYIKYCMECRHSGRKAPARKAPANKMVGLDDSKAPPDVVTK